MLLRALHPWNLTPAEAITLQLQLAKQLLDRDNFGAIRYIAGIDVGFEDEGRVTKAAVCVLAIPELRLVESVVATRATDFPYVPGLLSFREIPAILEALKQLRTLPDMLFCDGQGRAHPRRLGIASHLGLITELPSVGIAKSVLCGTHQPPAQAKGSHTPLIHRGEIVGAALRTRENVRPVYVSAGHKISLQSALEYVMLCVTRYKLPEPTRLADKLASHTPKKQRM
ncbi:MAG TPA: deoxyribonuclease V [Gammaproteobacteria bacterium]|nr:deoxyribonuclease V [Gammaproteobacteria bacterium]